MAVGASSKRARYSATGAVGVGGSDCGFHIQTKTWTSSKCDTA